MNYLAVCERAGTAPEGGVVARALKDLLARRTRMVELEYPCHGNSEERWFLLQATLVEGDDGGVVVAHVNITARKKLELAASALAKEPS